MIYVICIVFLMVTGTLTDGQPKIENYSVELEVNAGDEIHFKCKGNSKLRWRYPNESQNSTYIVNKFEYGKFSSELRKSRANFSDVGYYECIDETNANASIYVFVKGTGRLLLPTNLAYTGIQSKRVVIPCIPTQGDVNVTLERPYQEIDTSEWKFDNKIGFFHGSPSLKLAGHYSCNAEAPGFTEDSGPIALEIFKGIDNAPQPHLSDKEIVALVGGNVTLTCTVKTERTIKFQTEWVFPNKSKSIWEKYVSNSTSDNIEGIPYVKEILTLTIYNVSRQDEGEIVCLVTDHMPNVNNQSARLKVMEEGQIELKINEDTVKNISGKIHETLKWVIKYSAYPRPDIHWYDPHNNTITNSSKFIIVQTSHKIKLEIKNVDLNDTGTYYLEFNNGLYEVLQLNLTISSHEDEHIRGHRQSRHSRSSRIRPAEIGIRRW